MQTPRQSLTRQNRIKEQMCLFADRLSTNEMKANQLRLYFSALAYTLMEALRRLGLRGTDWAQAQLDTIRLKLFKIGAIVRISIPRILLQLSSTYPWKETSTPKSSTLYAAEARTSLSQPNPHIRRPQPPRRSHAQIQAHAAIKPLARNKIPRPANDAT